jgi:hypothetical protein
VTEREITWRGITTTLAASRLIARGESFALLLDGSNADTLRRVLGPYARLDRGLLSALAANLSLTALPGLMLYALGRGYALVHESRNDGSVRMRFQSVASRATAGPTSDISVGGPDGSD